MKLLNLCFLEVLLRIFQEHQIRNESDEDHSDDDSELHLFINLLLEDVVVILGLLVQIDVSVWSEANNLLALFKLGHLEAGLRSDFLI